MRLLVGLCSIAAASIGATPASAVVTEAGGHGYGMTPITGVDRSAQAAAYLERHTAAAGSAHARRLDEPPFAGSELQNLGGGPVMHSTTTHVIYWDPGGQFTTTTKRTVDGFFTDVAGASGAATNVFGVAGQYTDSTGHAAYSSTFAGMLVDSHEYPPGGNCTVPTGADEGPYERCLFDEQLQHELAAFIAEQGLPTGPTQLYFVLLPHKVATCLEERVCSNNVYCAYHGSIEPGTANEIIYADIPFSLLDSTFAKGCQPDGNREIQLPNGDQGSSDTETRFADVALKYISHEYIEAVTDPLVGFETAWVDREGLEIGDKCNGVPFGPAEEGEPGFDLHTFTPTIGGSAAAGTLFNQSIAGGSFYLQSEWDDAGSACLMRPLGLGAGSFSPPAAIAGVAVGFTGSAPDPYGALAPAWSFGDGGSGVGVSVSHAYATAGAYNVTMTPQDRLTGSTGAPVAHTITVAPAASGGGGGPTPVSVSGAAPPSTVPAITAAIRPRGFSTSTTVVNARTGVLTLTISVPDPGTLTLLATFPNGRFGAFASAKKCKKGQIKLGIRCLPSTVDFGKGSKSVQGAGTVIVTLRPTAPGTKALKSAIRQRRGMPVSIVLTFRSALGGAPVSHTQTVIVTPRR